MKKCEAMRFCHYVNPQQVLRAHGAWIVSNAAPVLPQIEAMLCSKAHGFSQQALLSEAREANT